ncbi:MAG TPA: hypothetical protein P5081_16330 [Phycisphaerae bacterium]|nr:hypothetical protein [Phycisphaerae bacterium]HRW54439.1 hypothetical protein [Phycisphaerae bacterium]
MRVWKLEPISRRNLLYAVGANLLIAMGIFVFQSHVAYTGARSMTLNAAILFGAAFATPNLLFALLIYPISKRLRRWPTLIAFDADGVYRRTTFRRLRVFLWRDIQSIRVESSWLTRPYHIARVQIVGMSRFNAWWSRNSAEVESFRSAFDSAWRQHGCEP